ncbi:MAG: putative Capsular polysaccharide biosynthesis glycosyl transferase [Sphingobacteriaceae bacterium]|jgi:glycosyltransferase involved in cell wall biosynthesis|nr:putative Capsular polysaccharide biosynthesis glycosyl transferase [Sphingobacteriaceae bacterium]
MTGRKLIRITTIPISLEKLLGGQLHFMKQYYDILAISSNAEMLSAFGKKEGIRTFPLRLTRKITPFQDLTSLWKLYRFLKKEKPFIVHTHTPKAGTVGMIAGRLAGVKHRLHTVAGLPLLEAKGLKRILLNAVERVTYACATKVYPNSSGLKAIIVKQGFCKEQKLNVIGNGSSNGIDTTFFSPDLYSDIDKKSLRRYYKLSDNDLVFIFVGRLVGDKGVNEIVSAFKELNGRVNKIKLLLVGPQESELDPLRYNTLTEINSNKNIISVGYQDDVRPFYGISDILVLPSYREGFPNVVLQAGSMGLASIVTDINGCNEIIIAGSNGLIVPPKSIDALVTAMTTLITDNELRHKLSSNARAMIISRYSQELVWEALLREYQSLN